MKKIFQFEPNLGEEEKEELVSVIDSGWYTEASKTKEFERMFASYVGRKYAVATTSGTAALCIAAQGLGLENNDEVIVPDFTFVASPNSIILAGSKVGLVDINKKNLCLDLEKTKKLVSKKTKAIMPVDFNGRAPDLVELKEFAESSNIAIIEDSCHGIGSFHAGKHTGCYSDVGIFSFSTPKIITTGQGGMLVTDDKELYEKFRMIKDFGRDIDKKHQMENAFEHTEMGYNFKFTEFQAAVGIAQMKKLPGRVEHNKKMFQMYRENLSDITEIEFVDIDLKTSVPWFSDILLPNEKIRQELIEHSNKFGIGTRKFYPPIHKLASYQNIEGDFEISDEISKRGLWLPSSSFLTDEEIMRVCDTIRNFWN
jgi:perosamine synthetase